MKKSIILVLITLFAAVGGYGYSEHLKERHAPKLLLGINAWPGYEFLYLAEKKGFFIEEGLNVTLKQFSSLQDTRLAFEHGQIDGMCTTITEMLQAYANVSKHANVALIVDSSNGADVILARAPIKAVGDLKGKRVAIEPMSFGMTLLARALEKSGLALQDIEILQYDQISMKEALEKSLVDAVVTYAPLSFKMDKIEGVDPIFTSAEIPDEIIDVVAIDKAYLQAHPEVIRALMRSWDRALDYAKAHPEEAYAIMADREGVTPEEFKASLDGVKLLNGQQQEALKLPGGGLEKVIMFTAGVLIQSNAMRTQITDPRNFIQMSSPPAP